ncbi:MAG TPA: DUF3501 family protein [Stellaceae bacterium]|jgi:hypothetical protein|nr:DUF3501 family protein [Stellaceae bacterium]
MPRTIARADILPPEEYAAERREHRHRVGELKRNRRIEVGPFVTFYFECFETMWLQVQEMLHIERGGEAQIADELAAYNPMIPNGSELSATVMIEIEDAERRQAALSRLGGIEHKMFLSIAGETVRGLADPTRENTSPEGKASSVQFVKFPLSPAQKEKFRAAGMPVVVGIDHPNYGHMAMVAEPVRQALAKDLE